MTETACDAGYGMGFWLLMSPVIAMLWLMATGLAIVWWRLCINPGISNGIK